MVSLRIQLILFVLTYFTNIYHCAKLTDVTDNILRGNSRGVIGSYVDFNQDKLVDILVIADRGDRVDVLYADLDSAFDRVTLVNLTSEQPPVVIVGVQATDFDGDALNDLALILRNKNGASNELTVKIYWGIMGDGQLTESYTITTKFKDDPMIVESGFLMSRASFQVPTCICFTPRVMQTAAAELAAAVCITGFFDNHSLKHSFDGDLHPDFLGEDIDGSRILMMSNSSHVGTRTFYTMPFPSEGGRTLPPLQVPQSSAFISLNADYYADLLVTTQDGYEVYFNENGLLKYNSTINFPTGYTYAQMKQVSLVDIDESGHIALVVPACNDTECKQPHIWVHKFDEGKNDWHLMLSGGTIDGNPWGYLMPSDNIEFHLPVTLRMGDYNMDGYVDALVMVRIYLQDGNSNDVAMLFLNTECSGPYCGALGRTLVPDPESQMGSIDGAILGTFFDIYDNGVLDVLLVTLTTSSRESEPYAVIKVYKQTQTSDACFVKIQVASGVCYNNCPNGAEPYSVNQYGATVKYVTTSVDGSDQRSVAGQLSQSAHFALQAPYTLFGLGMTPNYVDFVYVGMPQSVYAANNNINRFQDWAQIIPNSQLMVIPYPIDDASSWTMILFLTPSRLVYYTGAALLGGCGFVAGVAGLLHWRERREDAEEKRQESHKFHFDAM